MAIPKDATVSLIVASANHDPTRFPDPGRLDLTRTDGPHIAFGFGVHFCLGAQLARIEAQVLIGTLLRRFPDLALACAPEELEWKVYPDDSNMFRILAALPVRLA